MMPEGDGIGEDRGQVGARMRIGMVDGEVHEGRG